MKMLALAFLALAAPAPSAAQTPVQVPTFRSLSLQGGGTVTLRHGPVQKVTLVRGDAAVSEFRVRDDGTLEIRACRSRCSNYKLEVEIVTPSLSGLAIAGGGSIRSAGAFPERETLGISIAGGGTIDAEPIGAQSVAASIRGGGTIRTRARRSLATSIVGGGVVNYAGEPALTVSVHGGGNIRKISK
jgi:hypothetical protein